MTILVDSDKKVSLSLSLGRSFQKVIKEQKRHFSSFCAKRQKVKKDGIARSEDDHLRDGPGTTFWTTFVTVKT